MIAEDQVCERLAREILMLDENGDSLIPKYVHALDPGLEPLAPVPKMPHILVAGAGIAGLVAARILKRAGYRVTILEANDNRIGGRIKTFHTTEGGEPAFHDCAQYAEAGAMRIPTTHPLVNKLIEIMGLADRKQVFYNVDVAKNDDTKQTFRGWLKTNGLLARRIDYKQGHLPPGQLTMGFPIPDKFLGKKADELLAAALEEPTKLITPDPKVSPSEQREQQIRGWKEVIRRFDPFSMRTYLLDYFARQGVPVNIQDDLIAYIGTFQNLTSRVFLSFIHSFVDTFYISPGTSYVELAGGNWQLPESFRKDLDDNLVMDARLVEIRWSDGSEGDGHPSVSVRTVNEPMMKRGILREGRHHVERLFSGDYLLCAIPFSAMRFVDITPQLNYHKRRAIIELHYDSATKVLLEFSERFWEWDEATWKSRVTGPYRGHDACGGSSITDSPNRFIYFPSHAVSGSSGGVVLASYTWADEANRWDSIPAEDRHKYALNGLTDIYGDGIRKYFTGIARTESWMENYYSFGEAAVFAPGQMTALHPNISMAEGPIHFAGEHTSLKHAWIEGAIESGIRSALEIHERVKAKRKA
jgi:monoamine oxidase